MPHSHAKTAGNRWYAHSSSQSCASIGPNEIRQIDGMHPLQPLAQQARARLVPHVARVAATGPGYAVLNT